MIAAIDLTANLAQNITKLGIPSPGERDADGMKDPSMAILSAAILLFIFSTIAYATFGKTCRSPERNCCNRFLNWLPGRANAGLASANNAPGISV